MSKLTELSNDLLHNMVVKQLAETKNITEEAAKQAVSAMSFAEYHAISEAVITPPSGQTIAPSASAQQKVPAATKAPTNMKAIWPGQGAPVEVGMTVGTTGQNGQPAPGTVSQVDMAANGVKVKNPVTGKDEWVNTDALEPFVADQEQGSAPAAAGNDLQRLRELAGIKENCSSGATGAGAIAIAPTATGNVKRRQETSEEAPKKEYTPSGPAKTIVGDTKPGQASGELSANLAVRGKKTASRINNGLKR